MSDFLNVGDIITFPKHAESRVIEARTGSMTFSQGVPGKFRVKAIRDGKISLEIVSTESELRKECQK